MSKGTRVLVVDDQVLNRQGIMALLELTDDIDASREASDGQEAVQLVAKDPPDVVLMDVRMPVMDGLEATRQIKDSWPQVKVIILTMHPAHEAEAEAAGADRFLLKGVASSSLPEIIRSLTVALPQSQGAANQPGRESKKEKEINHE